MDFDSSGSDQTTEDSPMMKDPGLSRTDLKLRPHLSEQDSPEDQEEFIYPDSEFEILQDVWILGLKSLLGLANL